MLFCFAVNILKIFSVTGAESEEIIPASPNATQTVRLTKLAAVTAAEIPAISVNHSVTVTTMIVTLSNCFVFLPTIHKFQFHQGSLTEFQLVFKTIYL